MGNCNTQINQSFITDFLILLEDEDYKFKFLKKNNYKKLLKIKKILPGKLNIIDNNNILKNIVPKQMYIKLPKEQIYILSNMWKIKYIKSQIGELLYICGILGAEFVYIDYSNNNDIDKKKILKLFQNKFKYENKLNIISNIFSKNKGCIKYSKSIIKPSFDLIYRDKFIYYIDDWKHIIHNKLIKNVLFDSFNYIYINELTINESIINKFNNNNIRFMFNNLEYNNLKIKFNIKYYSLF